MSRGDRTPRARGIRQRAVRKAQRRARRTAARSVGAAAAAASLTFTGLPAADADHYPSPRPPHGIELLRDIRPGDGTSFPADPTNVRGTLYFAAVDPRLGRELWKSDGTTAGTKIVKDIWPGKKGGNPYELTAVGDELFFAADDGTHGLQLWKSDGTTAGTVRVRDIYPGATGYYASNLTNVDGTLFFTAEDGVHGRALWKSDGTRRGTKLVKDVNPADPPQDGSYVFSYLAAAGGTLFFAANDGTHGLELWKSDGTTDGTVLLQDIRPGAGSSAPRRMTAVGDTMFFSAADDEHGRELWTSDGTTSGTVMVGDMASPGDRDGSPYPLGRLGDRLVFEGKDGSVGSGVWISDGTTEGTQFLHRLNANLPGAVLGRGERAELYFLTDYDGLWKTDGTPEGTVAVTDLATDSGCHSPGYCEIASQLAAKGHSLYFVANDKGIGTEVWVSNGTPEGTGPVEDIYHGTAYGDGGAYPGYLTVSGGTLFFIARDDRHGEEIFRVGGPQPRVPRCDGLEPTIVGFDDIVGTPGDDVIVGSGGTDTIDGLGGHDVICGGGGWDTIDGGAGADVEIGGGGDDTFLAGSSGDGSDEIRGGRGDDTIDYAARTTPLHVTLDSSVTADDGVVGEHDDLRAVEVVEAGSADDVLIGGPGDETFDGGGGADTITGGAGDDREYGGGGDDTFLAGSVSDGGDVLEGQDGLDLVDYSARRRAVVVDQDDFDGPGGGDGETGEGDDVRSTTEAVRGGEGDDTLVGNDFGNMIWGGPGNDHLVGRRGYDTLDGGAGDDALDTHDDDASRDYASGGPGTDTAVFDPEDVITEVP
ncbi:ELWxxDGT repeat protein [Nocardioides sp. MH1]|uniref:ELWxxDGT repeat protein n=1 Tax=Nocardioides sp. MH1 TaxID=3242490 RepID=UPI0035227B39